jgi:hypothetical protein
MYPSDITKLKNKIHKVESDYLEWCISGCNNFKTHKDTFMLRVSLLELQKTIESILEQEEKLHNTDKKEFTLTTKISKCKDCPHYSNSSKDHDCAFTQEVHPVREYCNKLESIGAFNFTIMNSDEILPNCPMIKGN